MEICAIKKTSPANKTLNLSFKTKIKLPFMHILTRIHHEHLLQSSWLYWRWKYPCVLRSQLWITHCHCCHPYKTSSSWLPSMLELGCEDPGISVNKNKIWYMCKHTHTHTVTHSHTHTSKNFNAKEMLNNNKSARQCRLTYATPARNHLLSQTLLEPIIS